jgi:hypothetical protein
MITAGLRNTTILLALGLAGCVSTAKQETASPVAPPETVAVAPPPAVAMPRPPAVRPAPRVASANAPVPKAHPKTQSASVAPVDPDTLVGKSREQTRDLLGEPILVRDEQPATVWQFDGSGCILEVFFYMDLKENDFRALSYGVSTDGKPAAGSDAAGCVGRIKAKHDERLAS